MGRMITFYLNEDMAWQFVTEVSKLESPGIGVWVVNEEIKEALVTLSSQDDTIDVHNKPEDEDQG